MRWVLVALWCAMVATCGQKGPLYLPEERPPADSLGEVGDPSTRAAPGAHADAR